MNTYSGGVKSFAYKAEREEPRMGKGRCQNCGKEVDIWLPFHGCIFCEDCSKPHSYSFFS